MLGWSVNPIREFAVFRQKPLTDPLPAVLLDHEPPRTCTQPLGESPVTHQVEDGTRKRLGIVRKEKVQAVDRLDALGPYGRADHRNTKRKSLEDLQTRSTAALQRHDCSLRPAHIGPYIIDPAGEFYPRIRPRQSAQSGRWVPSHHREAKLRNLRVDEGQDLPTEQPHPAFTGLVIESADEHDSSTILLA